MPNQERTFEAGGRSYTIRFTQNALYRLEKELGRPLAVALRSLGIVELQVMMWAGLEGARLKRRSEDAHNGHGADVTGSDRPYTIEEVGDIFDELGGASAAAPIIMDAWRAAMPRRENIADADRSDKDPTEIA